MVAGIFAMMAVQLTDNYFVGQLGVDELAALGFSTRVVFVLMALAVGLGAGAVSLVARAAGRGSDEELKDLTTATVILAAVTSLIVSVLGAVFVEPLFRALGAQESLIPDIKAYMRVWFGGLALLIVPMVASNVLRAVGDTLWPSLLMIGSAALNAMFDPILIHGWGPIPAMGVSGAAWATLLSRAFAFAAFIWLLVGVRGLISFHAIPWRRVKRAWSEVLRVGLPAVGTNMINPLGMVFATSAMAGAGVAAVAGFSVATTIEMFAIVPLFALSAAIGPLTGQNVAAEEDARVQAAFRTSYLYAAIWAGVIAVVFWVAGAEIIALFNKEEDPDVPRYALSFLTISPITTAGYGAVMVMAAGLNAMGRPWPGLSVTLIRSLLLYAPGVWIGLQAFGPMGAAVGIALANIGSGLAAVFYSETRAVKTRPAAEPAPA